MSMTKGVAEGLLSLKASYCPPELPVRSHEDELGSDRLFIFLLWASMGIFIVGSRAFWHRIYGC
jgi:hypothetical protein